MMALTYLHRMGYVHRNVKLTTILFADSARQTVPAASEEWQRGGKATVRGVHGSGKYSALCEHTSWGVVRSTSQTSQEDCTE